MSQVAPQVRHSLSGLKREHLFSNETKTRENSRVTSFLETAAARSLIWGTKLHVALPIAVSTGLVRIDQILFAGRTLAVGGDILKLKRLLQ